MLLFVLSLVGLVLVALLLGVHLTGLVALNPALRVMKEEIYFPMKWEIDITAPRLAKPLMLSCLAVSVCVLVVATVMGDAITIVASAVALVALIVVFLAILRGDLPINRTMAGWSLEDLPADWREVRVRWERFFALRVAANSLAMLASVSAVLVSAIGLD